MKQGERKERENLIIDWLDELQIYKLESKSHQNNRNLPTLFSPYWFWRLNSKLRSPKNIPKSPPKRPKKRKH